MMRKLFQMTALGLALSFGTVSCTGGQIDPVKLTEAIKTSCGIAVVAASIATIINAGVGMTIQAIVDAVCSAYKAQAAAQAATGQARASGIIHLPVVINGKTIDVDVTVP